jgi:hypothetical protein
MLRHIAYSFCVVNDINHLQIDHPLIGSNVFFQKKGATFVISQHFTLYLNQISDM